MIRVLLFGVSSGVGGIETFLMKHIEHMDLNEIKFELLCNTEHPAFEETWLKMGIPVYKVSPRSKHPVRFHKELKDFFEQHKGQYAVFWCNKCMLTNIDFLKVAKKYHIPVRIIHSHNSALMDVGLKGILMRFLHERGRKQIASYATDFWACSDFAAKWFYSDEMIESNHYQFIPNAVDVDKFCYKPEVRKAYREQLGIQNQFVIGHVGRFHQQKNHMFLLDIFHEVQKKCPDSVLLLIGTGELQSVVKERVKQLGLEKKVQFLGVRDDVSEIMQAMDCFLLPSLYEGLPVVAVEAQAAGLPCYLASDGITKQAKLLESSKFLSLSDDAQKWAETILQTSVEKRIDTRQQIVEKGFEIKAAARNLQKQLISMALENERNV